MLKYIYIYLNVVVSSGGFDFTVIALMGAVVIFALMCTLGIMETPVDNSFYAVQEAQEKQMRRKMCRLKLWNMCHYCWCCLCITKHSKNKNNVRDIEIENVNPPEEMKMSTQTDAAAPKGRVANDVEYQQVRNNPQAVSDSSVL